MSNSLIASAATFCPLNEPTSYWKECYGSGKLSNGEIYEGIWIAGQPKGSSSAQSSENPNTKGRVIDLRESWSLPNIKFTEILAKEWVACWIRSGGKYKDLKGHLVASDLAIVVKSKNPTKAHFEQEVSANASRITFD